MFLGLPEVFLKNLTKLQINGLLQQFQKKAQGNSKFKMDFALIFDITTNVFS